MLLSKLVYQSIIASDLLGDGALSYDDLLKGIGSHNNDYARAINLAFVPLNEYFQRLSNLDQIRYAVEDVGLISSDSLYIPLANLKNECKKVVSVFQYLEDGDYRTISYRLEGNQIRITGSWLLDKDVHVQYAINMPMFSYSDIPSITINSDESETTVGDDVDLYSKYGITNNACSHAIEWVQGKLMEDSAPELANLHINHVESYLSGLDPVNIAFNQQRIEAKFHQ
jgi:hypothetical protein